jgi:hypothetical protein
MSAFVGSPCCGHLAAWSSGVIFFDAGMTWHYQSFTLAIANFLRPQGKH